MLKYGMPKREGMHMDRKKYFIITIDTEGDNLWGWEEGTPIKTENILYLSRFQDLCNQYDFKPTWLSNWEMVNDDRFVTFAKKNLARKQCEIGMHLHAWNTPPEYESDRCYARKGCCNDKTY